MNQPGAVDGVLAVIARVMVTARNINFAFVNKGKQLRTLVFKLRGIGRLKAGEVHGLLRHGRPGKREGRLRAWHLGRSGMTWPMRMPSKRHTVVSSTTLMVETQGVSAGKTHCNPIINQKWQRGAQTSNFDPIFAGDIEGREVSDKNFLVRSGTVFESNIRPRDQRALENVLAGVGIHQAKTG